MMMSIPAASGLPAFMAAIRRLDGNIGTTIPSGRADSIG
jgi:hypothetical protein